MMAKEMSFRGSTKMGTVGLLKTMRCLKRQPLTNREQMSPESLSTLTPAAITHNLSALTRAVLVADKKKGAANWNK